MIVFKLGIPQILMVVLLIYSISLNVVKHGKPKENYNAWIAIPAVIMEIGLLIWGGFFR